MSQVSGRPCPTCGTHVPAGQRFCSNCGTTMEVPQPGNQYGGPPPQNFPQPSPVPPYAQAPYGQQQQQYQQYQPPPQKSNPIAEALGALGLLFFLRRYRPGYRARRQSSGCCGCLVLLVILLAVFGTPAYFYYKANPHVIQQIQQNVNTSNASNASSNTSGNGSAPTKQPTITTIKTGQTVTYEGVDITIVDVKQATTFLDDNSGTTNGMIRLDIKESAGPQVGIYGYGEIFRLILPNGNIVLPSGEENNGSPALGTSRNNWVDFQVSTGIKPNQIQLLLGTPQDAQIKFFLTGKVDPQFLAKTSSPNVTFTYDNIQWTITKATITYSAEGRQATTGNIYVTISLSAANHSNQDFINNAPGYMRMMEGSVANQPIDDGTLNSSILSSSTVTGDVSFLMPQGNTSFTLMMLGNPPITQVSQNFQV